MVKCLVMASCRLTGISTDCRNARFSFFLIICTPALLVVVLSHIKWASLLVGCLEIPPSRPMSCMVKVIKSIVVNIYQSVYQRLLLPDCRSARCGAVFLPTVNFACYYLFQVQVVTSPMPDLLRLHPVPSVSAG